MFYYLWSEIAMTKYGRMRRGTTCGTVPVGGGHTNICTAMGGKLNLELGKIDVDVGKIDKDKDKLYSNSKMH